MNRSALLCAQVVGEYMPYPRRVLRERGRTWSAIRDFPQMYSTYWPRLVADVLR